MRLAWLAAVGIVLVMPAAAAQAAAPTVLRLAEYVDSDPLLGVDARGNAVTTFLQTAELYGGKPREQRSAIFASLHRAGHGFDKPTRISRRDRGVRSDALAVGASGDGAIVWQSDRAGEALFVNRRRAGKAFAAAAPLPGSRGATQPAAAIDARGRLLVAWLKPASQTGCGMVVVASIAPRGGTFHSPRRVSAPCAHAGFVRAALARDGSGAIAWRSAGPRSAVSASSVRVSTYAGGRFRAPRAVSTAANVGQTLQLVAGGHRALAVWRDHASVGSPAANRVLAASIIGDAIAPPVELLSSPRALLRDVYASMNVADAAIVAWQRSDDSSSSVYDAFGHGEVTIRPSADGAFSAPVALGDSFEVASSFGLTGVALDAAGTALAGIEDVVVRRSPAGAWGKPMPLRHRKDYSDPEWPPAGAAISLGLSDAGEGVAVWSLEDAEGGSTFIRAAVIPAVR
jgi:hypothetical protein